VDGFVNEIKTRATSSPINVRFDWLAVLMFLPYVLAAAFGLCVRGCGYLVAALEVGFHDGLHGKARKKE
jgi:hypothetical protein